MNRCKFRTAFRLEINGLLGIPVRSNFNGCMSFTKEGCLTTYKDQARTAYAFVKRTKRTLPSIYMRWHLEATATDFVFLQQRFHPFLHYARSKCIRLFSICFCMYKVNLFNAHSWFKFWKSLKITVCISQIWQNLSSWKIRFVCFSWGVTDFSRLNKNSPVKGWGGLNNKSNIKMSKNLQIGCYT